MTTSSFWFGLESTDGVVRGAFSHFTISSAVEPVGGESSPGAPQVTRVRPSVTVGRMLNTERDLFGWHETVVDHGVAAARKDCAITVFDASGLPVARYTLELAWPARVSFGPLQMGDTSVVGEVATLVCENVRRVAL